MVSTTKTSVASKKINIWIYLQKFNAIFSKTQQIFKDKLVTDSKIHMQMQKT